MKLSCSIFTKPLSFITSKMLLCNYSEGSCALRSKYFRDLTFRLAD